LRGRKAHSDIARLLAAYCLAISQITPIRFQLDFQNKTKQNKTKQNKTKQNKTKQNKTKQNKTKQNKTKQNKTKQNKTKQNKTKQNKTKQNKNTLTFRRFKAYLCFLFVRLVPYFNLPFCGIILCYMIIIACHATGATNFVCKYPFDRQVS
jgi:Flp pilus assembly protein TadB